jgi:glyoxylase-like metal-dependent hydrolase (beta-lactamase superfamily II)/rhodanese-related sulfurtransferase
MTDNSISPNTLKNLLKQENNSVIIVDIRDTNEYNDWNIKGSRNVPVNQLMAKGEYSLIKTELSTLPKNKKIVTVCARGINAQVAAYILRDLGYNAVSLENGMKGWNEVFEVFEIEFPSFILSQFVRVGKGCLSYIIYSKLNRSAIVIEPSIFSYEYINYAEKHKLNITHIIDTHAHADHFSGGMKLAEILNTDYYINGVEVDNLFNFKSLKDIYEIRINDICVNIISTPGHTDGSLSLIIDKQALICGDLLLLESPGRPDLARTKEDTLKGAGILFDTLQAKILKLNDSMKVFPSHFTSSELRPVVLSLGELKIYNHPLTISDKNEFINYLTANIPLTPPNYESIKKFNKAGAILPMDYAEDLEIGPNRCAARNP